MDASRARLAVLKDTLAKARQKADDLARKSNGQCFDVLLKISDELNGLEHENGDLKNEVDDLKESMDDLQAEYDDLEPSYNAIILAYEVLEHHSNNIEARGRDLDQENKDLQVLNTSLTEENSDLHVSTYNLERDRSSLRSLYAHTCDQNASLYKTLKHIQDTSAANAQQVTLSATALQRAESRITVLEEQIDYYKDLLATKDKLIFDAINDNQALLTSLAALQGENTRLVKAASDQETESANKNIEISALRCEISLQETASSRAKKIIDRLVDDSVARKAQLAEIDGRISALHDRLEPVSDQCDDRIAAQEQAAKRLLEVAAEREDYIKALHSVILFNAEKREEAEKKLAWHRLAFEEQRECARGGVSGAAEADAEQLEDNGGIGLEFATKPLVSTYDLPFPPVPNESSFPLSGVDQLIEETDQPHLSGILEDFHASATDAQDPATTTVPARPETNGASISEEDPGQSSDVADDGFTEEEDLHAFSAVADEASSLDNTSTADTLVLTESEASIDSDFEAICLSDGDSDVDVLLE